MKQPPTERNKELAHPLWTTNKVSIGFSFSLLINHVIQPSYALKHRDTFLGDATNVHIPEINKIGNEPYN